MEQGGSGTRWQWDGVCSFYLHVIDETEEIFLTFGQASFSKQT